MKSKAVSKATPKDVRSLAQQYATTALVLQGGGALGSYQAGVYEGLQEAGVVPNWIAGISVGALNTAIIAGNAPENRVAMLKAFWETICTPAYLPPLLPSVIALIKHASEQTRQLFNTWEAGRAIFEGQKGFFIPRVPSPLLGLSTGPTHASFYDTSPLKATLEKFVDFDRIKAGEMHVAVGAVNVRTGNFKYFDNTDPDDPLLPEHFMASGALPPAFPAVEIKGEYYWDGGLMSNTPLYDLLTQQPRKDTLAFQVDLWSAKGKVPENIYDVTEREKDIQYSSRTRMITDYMENIQTQRNLLDELLKLIPPEIKKNNEFCLQAMERACTKRFNVIHLIYQDKVYEGFSKDYEFGSLTMNEHWAAGLNDIEHTLAHSDWLEMPPEAKPFMTHDVHRGRRPNSPDACF